LSSERANTRCSWIAKEAAANGLPTAFDGASLKNGKTRNGSSQTETGEIARFSFASSND
jgi:hypothetical protein